MGCKLYKMTCWRPGTGCNFSQSKLQMVKDELFTSQSELHGSREELGAARDELRNKTAQLDEARREASEVVSFVERLTDECHGLRGDLHRQETLVVKRDEVIASLRDEACTQWASRWLVFQKKVVAAYQGLGLNFDIPSDKEVEESLSAYLSGELDTHAKAYSLLLPLMSDLPHVWLFFFFFLWGLGPRTYIAFFLMNIHFLSHHFRFYLRSSRCSV